MRIKALLARRFDTVNCWESQNFRESVVDLPRLIKLTVDEDITSYVTLRYSGADLFVWMKCFERLTRFKGRSAVFISLLKTIKRKVKRQRADQLVVLVENVSSCRTCPRTNCNNKASFNCKIFRVYRHIG